MHVLRPHAKRFGCDHRQHHVGALAELGGAARHGHAAAAVDLHVRAGVRQVVPVDGQPGAGDVGAARDAHTLPARQLPVLRRERRGGSRGIERLAKAHGGDAKAVHRARSGRLKNGLAIRERIETEIRRDLVELDLERVARLRGAVTALRAARRLVRVQPHAVELVRRNLVRHRHQRAGVVRGRDAIRRVGAAVEPRLRMDSGDFARRLDARAHAHQHRVPAAVRVKDFFAVQCDLDGPPCALRQQARRELVAERIALAAEAAAVGRGDHPDMRARHAQHFLQLAMQIVRDLRRRPQRQLAVAVPGRHRRMRLDRRVRVAVVEKPVVAHVVGGSETRVHVAELQVHVLEDVGLFRVRVQLGQILTQGILNREDGREQLVFHVDQSERVERRVFVHGRNRGDRLTHIPHLADCQRRFVLSGRHDAHELGHVRTKDDVDHAGMGKGAGDVDRHDPGVSVGRAQEPAVQHARQKDVVRVFRAARQMVPGVDLGQAMADDGEVTHGHGPPRVPAASCSPPARWPRR